MTQKHILSLLVSAALLCGLLAGCSSQGAVQSPAGAGIAPSVENLSVQTAQNEAVAPKYVFLFIGDGMSYPQIQSTADYPGCLDDEDYWQAQPSLDDNQAPFWTAPATSTS